MAVQQESPTDCRTAVRMPHRPRLRRIQCRIPLNYAPRAAAFRPPRLEDKPARRCRAHRTLRPLRQPLYRRTAFEARQRALDRHVWAQYPPTFRRLRSPACRMVNSPRLSSAPLPEDCSAPIGVDADIEFVATGLDPLAGITSTAGTKTYANRGSLQLLFEDLLGDLRFRSPWRDFDNSVTPSCRRRPRTSA